MLQLIRPLCNLSSMDAGHKYNYIHVGNATANAADSSQHNVGNSKQLPIVCTVLQKGKI